MCVEHVVKSTLACRVQSPESREQIEDRSGIYLVSSVIWVPFVDVVLMMMLFRKSVLQSSKGSIEIRSSTKITVKTPDPLMKEKVQGSGSVTQVAHIFPKRKKKNCLSGTSRKQKKSRERFRFRFPTWFAIFVTLSNKHTHIHTKENKFVTAN